MIETWPASRRESYLYTDSPTVAAFVKRDFPQCATYEGGGRVFAWQFLLPNQVLKVILPRLEREEAQEQIAA